MESTNNIKEQILTSKETQEILGISRARLCQLVKAQKLKQIKKGLFLLEDVLSRRDKQKELRAKFYRPKNDR